MRCVSSATRWPTAQTATALVGEQMLTVVGVGRRHNPANELKERVRRRINLRLALRDQAKGGEQQEPAEDEQDPVETVDELDARKDEQAPKHDRAKDPPEQHSVLKGPRHREKGEDQRPHEHIVNAQAELDQIPREPFTGSGPAVGREHDHTERDANSNPDRELDAGPARAAFLGFAVNYEDVDREEKSDDDADRRPRPPRDFEVDASSLCREDQRVSPPLPMTAWAAARRAIGTRNGEQLT